MSKKADAKLQSAIGRSTKISNSSNPTIRVANPHDSVCGTHNSPPFVRHPPRSARSRVQFFEKKNAIKHDDYYPHTSR